MRNTLKIAIVLFVLVFSNGISAQEKTKKELKEARKNSGRGKVAIREFSE
jgi:hypothetical protein